MNSTEIYERLNEVFRDVFDDESILVNDTTTSSDIDGWDSLMHITLISAIEEEFDIKFEMREVVGFKNVGEMANAIERENS